jgi:hypothetical protein
MAVEKFLERGSVMSSSIADLLRRLTLIESDITPVSVKSGLNAQQKSVDQLPALFRPKNIRALGSATDPEHPMRHNMVGDDLQIDVAQSPLEEKMHGVEEEIVDKVRRDLNSYLDALRNTTQPDRRLVKKAKQGVGIRSMDEDPTQSEPPPAYTPEPTINPVMPESAVTKIAMEDGRTCEVYGDTDRGFEIGHNGRRLKNRFKTLEQATLAIEIYQRRCAGQAQNRDYLDEA